ncbi:uncharacterized protein LOC133182027 [Saccostrea echinata]|uniref:uncharacterized protein LOC133182027 n=1 Tax=Saccostrea echinata TaxID=191078 RepID=UPI002A80E9ED|nr:uncharacterized protein LOC133182027 [Saccostrea echinata]
MQSTSFLQILLAFALIVHETKSWRVVLKVGNGKTISPATSIENLWLSNVTVNDDRSTYVYTRDTVVSRYEPTYKSHFINSWYGIKQVKIAMYKDGKEGMFLIFNTTGHNRGNFFKVSNIIKSSFTDLTESTNYNMSISGHRNRSFEIVSADGGYCTNTTGWTAAMNNVGMSSCFTKESAPYFLFAKKTKTMFNNMTVADAFAVFVGDCIDQPCNYGGVCIEHLEDFTCQCPSQYYGKTCDIDCPCAYGTCHEVTEDDVTPSGIIINGTFINNSSFTLDNGRVRLACQCVRGYEGVNCDKNVDDCIGNPCQNGGVCVDKLNGYTCDCPLTAHGPTCQYINPEQDSTMKTGGVVAVAVTVPLVLILLGAMIGYGVYIYKNPEGFGRSTTYKQFAMARDFVRRSFRRMSGRRPKPPRILRENSNGQEGSGKKDEKSGFDNLGFNEPTGTGGSVPVYRRENSEMYELSANDQSVVTGPNASYEKLNINKGRSENQYQQLNQAKEIGGRERPRQTGRQGREKYDDLPPKYDEIKDQSRYESSNTGFMERSPQIQQQNIPPPSKPKYQPRNMENTNSNNVTINQNRSQQLNTPGRHEAYEPRSQRLGSNNSANKNIPYDRFRSGQSSSAQYEQRQEQSAHINEGNRDSYDGYRGDVSPSSAYGQKHGQKVYGSSQVVDNQTTEDIPYDRYPNDRSPSSPHGRQEYSAKGPHFGNVNKAVDNTPYDRYKDGISPTSPYGQNQRFRDWGGHDPQDRYNDAPSPGYRGVNHNAHDTSGVSSPEQVVFVSKDHMKEVSI